MQITSTTPALTAKQTLYTQVQRGRCDGWMDGYADTWTNSTELSHFNTQSQMDSKLHFCTTG